MNNRTVHYKTIRIDGLEIFYREAGNPANQSILLLHGFPSSSHMFRNLINELSDTFHLIAPDYPGFGQSSAPSNEIYEYSFDNLTITIFRFIDALGLKRFSLYLHDYGGPIGFRIAQQTPESIESLIIQNANAYMEGIGEALKPLATYMQNPNAATEKQVRVFFDPDTIKWLYVEGAEDTSKVSPDGYIMDQLFVSRSGNDIIQLALFRNYSTNLDLYDNWQKYFRRYQPPTLIIWGKNDPMFTKQGADAFKKDLRNAELHLLSGGHFVLEEKNQEVATLIKSFLLKRKPSIGFTIP